MKRGKRVIKSQLNDAGIYPVYQNSLLPLGFFNEYNCRAESVFMISAGAAGKIGFSDVDFWAADDCWIFDCHENLSERFLYYALKNQQNTIDSGVRRSSIPRLSRIFIENIKIPIPPLEKQKQIVSILDKFDALVNDISIGLPAEIEAYLPCSVLHSRYSQAHPPASTCLLIPESASPPSFYRFPVPLVLPLDRKSVV